MLAQRARDRFAQETGRSTDGLLVAGSVGPYGAMLADGSEYTRRLRPGDAALRDVHAPRIEALLEAGVDLLAFETIPTIREAAVLLDLLAESGATAWLRTSVVTVRRRPPANRWRRPSRSRPARTGVVAVGVNCGPPRHVPALLAAAAAAAPDMPLIAYPNGGERWDAASRRWLADDGDGYDPAEVASWAELGATWLGGCCGTGPADIAALAGQVRAA